MCAATGGCFEAAAGQCGAGGRSLARQAAERSQSAGRGCKVTYFQRSR